METVRYEPTEKICTFLLDRMNTNRTTDTSLQIIVVHCHILTNYLSVKFSTDLCSHHNFVYIGHYMLENEEIFTVKYNYVCIFYSVV